MSFEFLRESRPFWLLFAALLLLGGVLRFWNLAEIPTDPREVGSAAVSARILQTGEYRHNPLTHGPLLYYLDAAAFAFGGVSIATARVVPALAGALLPLAFLPFRRHLGGAGVVAATGLYAVSPTQVAVAHLNTPDTLLLLLDLLVLAALLRFVETGNGRLVLLGALAFGLSATAKEQTFLNALLALGAVGVMGLVRPDWVAGPLGLRAQKGREGAFTVPELALGFLGFLGRHRALLLRGALVAFGAFALLYTAFLTFLPGLLLALFQLVIWTTGAISPQFLETFYGPPGYYVPFLLRFDLVVALLALAGGAWAWRRGRRFEAFLVLLGLSLLLFFSAIPYKNSKLLVYPLLPWALAAGAALGRLFTAGGVRRIGAGLLAAVVAAQSATGLAGLPGAPGVLSTEPSTELDLQYASLEEMAAIISEVTLARPDLNAYVFSPAEVSVRLVDTSYYFIWGARHLKEQPTVALLVEDPGATSLLTVPSRFALCKMRFDARTRTTGLSSDIPEVAEAIRSPKAPDPRERPDALWDFCVFEFLRAKEYPVVGTTGELAPLFDATFRSAGYVRASLNTTLSGPLVAYLPGRLGNESRELFTKYPALRVEWLPA
ncbi:MAG: TIGR03663 family protein [Halobacteria archaeon]